MSQSVSLFSLEGKADTRQFWTVHSPVLGIQIFGVALILLASGAMSRASWLDIDLFSDWGLALAALLLLPLWPQIALASQRLADRGKSKHWLLLFYAPTAMFWLVSITAGLPAALDLSLKLSVVLLMLAAWYYYELGLMPAEQAAQDHDDVAVDEHAFYQNADDAIARAVSSLRSTAESGAVTDRRHGGDRRVGAPDTRGNPVDRRSSADRRKPQGFGRRIGG